MRLKISGGVVIVLIVGMIGAQTASAGQNPFIWLVEPASLHSRSRRVKS